MSGVERIAAERKRQIEEEGFTHESDLVGAPDYGTQLSYAGLCYAGVNKAIDMGWDVSNPPPAWPWDKKWWKPSLTDPIRNLEKAGALIAAAIDYQENLPKSEPV